MPLVLLSILVHIRWELKESYRVCRGCAQSCHFVVVKARFKRVYMETPMQLFVGYDLFSH